ncbi:MAG: hypothetical protein IJM04_02555 [Prevotella sp.]|nr:hypothetical protein [Prevotella sp.]
MAENMNVNGDFGQTNSNCDDILNTPEDLKEDNPSEEGLSCFIGEYDWVHGFSKGDVVWYRPDSSYVIKRSRIVEMKATEGAITKDRLFLENGDEVGVYNAYHSKKAVLEHLIRQVKSEIGQHKMTQASTQHRLEESERRLRVLEKNLSKIEDKETLKRKDWTFSEVYEHRADILAHPEEYDSIITHFSAGGLGACAYSRNISIATLVRCWEHPEFRISCPECGGEALITMFAGAVNSGGYWALRCFCPTCGKEHYFHRYDSYEMPHHWSALARIAHECAHGCSASNKTQEGVGDNPLKIINDNKKEKHT